MKKKKVVLSINDKLRIINRLNKGKTASALTSEFKVGKSTITEITKVNLC